MNQAFAELAEGQKAILDRLDTVRLKSMLKAHLQERGISEAFELGILDDEGQIIGIGPQIDTSLLRTQGMQAKLFPNDILGKDKIYMSYGYLTAGSGPREFYEVLEKVVD